MERQTAIQKEREKIELLKPQVESIPERFRKYPDEALTACNNHSLTEFPSNLRRKRKTLEKHIETVTGLQAQWDAFEQRVNQIEHQLAEEAKDVTKTVHAKIAEKLKIFPGRYPKLDSASNQLQKLETKLQKCKEAREKKKNRKRAREQQGDDDDAGTAK